MPPQPHVSVIIPTRGRPRLLRTAIRSILTQTYAGSIDICVVFDQVDIDPLDDARIPDSNRSLHTLSNSRTPGLAGGRNTGILATTGELIAFCDDDDEWAPDKIAKQVEAWRRDPDAALVSCGIRIETEDRSVIRLAPEHTGFAQFLESRVTEIHPSSFLMRRDMFTDDFGLIDEVLPASYGEDYDLLLRATRNGHVASVPEPLVIVHWDRASFFSGKWQGIADGLSYLLDKHPEFATSPTGSARIEGQVAFALAALKRRPEARRWARRALHHDRSQLRAYAALAIAARLAPAAPLITAINKHGRGL